MNSTNRRTMTLLMVASLAAGCECGAPWMMADCAEPGVSLQILDQFGNAAMPDTVVMYRDRSILEDYDCSVDNCSYLFLSIYEPGVYEIEVTLGDEVQTHQTVIDTIAEGQCCGGGPRENATLSFTVAETSPLTDCELLAPDECALDTTCGVISGWTPTVDSAGNECIDYTNDRVNVGCHDADMACPAVMSYAHAPDSDVCVVFGGCIPHNWVNCDAGPPLDDCTPPPG